MAIAQEASIHPAGPRAAHPRGARGRFWLDGSAVFCACPDCRAPVSVRVWLLLADCWRCGASIELTDEEEREVQRLLTGQPAPATPIPPTPPPLQPRPSLVAEGAAPLAPTAATLGPPRAAVSIASDPWLRRLLEETPAWLISLLVHLVLFALLGLLTAKTEKPPRGPFITLSSMISREVKTGGDAVRFSADELAQLDLPLPSRADLNDERQRKAMLAAAQDARELRLDDSANL